MLKIKNLDLIRNQKLRIKNWNKEVKFMFNKIKQLGELKKMRDQAVTLQNIGAGNC